MKPILKKILSYTAIAFLGFATGVGCLIGVSSCSVKNDDHQETQIKEIISKPNIKSRKITFSREFFENDTPLYFRAKNYSTNGEGVFYQVSISLDNSAPVTHLATGYSNIIMNSLKFQTIKNNNVVYQELYFRPQLNGGVYKINHIYFNYLSYPSTAIYSAEGNVFNRSICAFVAIGPFSAEHDGVQYETDLISYVNQFFDVYELSNETFTFYNFNYNMLLQIDDSFVERALYPVSNLPVSLPSSYPNPFEINLGTSFYSGGLAFDTIRVYWGADLGYNFEQSDGTFKTYAQPVVNTYVAYFKSMTYYNSATQYEANVCARGSYVDGTGNSATHIFYKPTWVNDEYKTITLYGNINYIRVRNILNGVNNGLEGFAIKNDIDVGLGNVFDLLSLAFTSWGSLFAIQIVPGITIGLLLFLPLITGIIILIIWIVKR